MKKHYSLLLCLFMAMSSFFVACDEKYDFDELFKCQITVTCTEGGKVKISKYFETSEIVMIGSEIEVVATPDEGYIFTGWYVGNFTEPVSTDAVLTFVATKNMTLTAHFTKLSNLSICSAGNGSVSFKDITETSRIVPNGTEVTVVAAPYADCYFIGWFIADENSMVSTDIEYTFTVEDDITLTAQFGMPVGEAIDLGLPSGIKWANMNVGASTPEAYGGYYAWGETDEKNDYSWSTYKWCNGNYNTMTKYCINKSDGTVDKKNVLDPEDDVAHVKWGGDWRMPTETEYSELMNNCTWNWTTQNGVTGYKITGSNGNSIFLPVAGCYFGEYNIGNYPSYYSSSSLYGNGSYFAYCLYIGSENYYDYTVLERCCGFSVRPVCE